MRPLQWKDIIKERELRRRVLRGVYQDVVVFVDRGIEREGIALVFINTEGYYETGLWE